MPKTSANNTANNTKKSAKIGLKDIKIALAKKTATNYKKVQQQQPTVTKKTVEAIKKTAETVQTKSNVKSNANSKSNVKSNKSTRKQGIHRSITKKTLQHSSITKRDLRSAIKVLMDAGCIPEITGLNSLEKEDMIDRIPVWSTASIYMEIEKSRNHRANILNELKSPEEKRIIKQLENLTSDAIKEILKMEEIEIKNKNQMRREELIYNVIKGGHAKVVLEKMRQLTGDAMDVQEEEEDDQLDIVIQPRVKNTQKNVPQPAAQQPVQSKVVEKQTTQQKTTQPAVVAKKVTGITMESPNHSKSDSNQSSSPAPVPQQQPKPKMIQHSARQPSKEALKAALRVLKNQKK